MDTRDIEYVITVAECHNISKAAQILHISQPALSQRIQKLEAEFGCKLIIRDKPNFRLTEQGHMFICEGKKILQIHTNLLNSLCPSKKDKRDSIILAASTTYSKYWFSSVFYTCRERLPHVELQLVEASHDRRIKLLNDKEATFAIVLTNRAGTLGQRDIFREHTLFVISEEMLAQKREYVYKKNSLDYVNLQGFANTPFLGYSSGTNMEEITNILCANSNFIPNIVFKTNDPDLLLKLIACGMGVGFVTSMAVHNTELEQKHLRCFYVESPYAVRNYSLVWSDSVLLTDNERHFIEVIKSMHRTTSCTSLYQFT